MSWGAGSPHQAIGPIGLDVALCRIHELAARAFVINASYILRILDIPLRYPKHRVIGGFSLADTVYLENLEETDVLLSKLSQPVRDWFKDKFPDFTDPQKMAIPSIVDGEHLLLCSPTGSGKTLTAFLSIIDKLVRLAMDGDLEKKVYCIYISPIKALANDIQRNLIGPLTEIKYLNRKIRRTTKPSINGEQCS